MNKLIPSIICVLTAGFALTTWASELDVPNEFTSGTAAVAAEVNANFSEVETAVNDNDARISTLESTLTSVVARIDDTTSNGSSKWHILAPVQLDQGEHTFSVVVRVPWEFGDSSTATSITIDGRSGEGYAGKVKATVLQLKP